ncbi:hypothetical protein ZHAS_00017510 [Anopheles sinensis]|uniref:Uncharacterized protein n=1 Tax=Anopheles sinensis TaxID=74873 RepID=A0A084WGR5_ANOSI|nr:hypothetical protein ZHAS_00017510 [Anopheles sinensis]
MIIGYDREVLMLGKKIRQSFVHTLRAALMQSFRGRALFAEKETSSWESSEVKEKTFLSERQLR